MRRDLVDILCCPACKAPLSLAVTREEAEVIEGSLTCASCGHAYPIREGIPDLLPPDFQ